MTNEALVSSQPKTQVLLDETFMGFFQRASLLGNSLLVTVNKDALQQAVADTGLSDDTVSIVLKGTDDAVQIEIASSQTAVQAEPIDKDHWSIYTAKSSQHALQASLIGQLLTLAEKENHKASTLCNKVRTRPFESAKRNAKIMGGYILGMIGSTAVFETIWSGDQHIVKVASIALMAVKIGNGIHSNIKPLPAPEEGLLLGYPPFVEFKANQDQT